MAKKIAHQTDARSDREAEYKAIGKDRADLEAHRKRVREEQRRHEERVASFVREAEALGAATEGLHNFLDLLLDRPQAAARPVETRTQREILYHRRCLALLRLGRTPQEAETEARELERDEDRGGGEADPASRSLRVVCSLFCDADLRRAKVRELAYRIAREALGPEFFPLSKSHRGEAARLVKDTLRGSTRERLLRLKGDFLTRYGRLDGRSTFAFFAPSFSFTFGTEYAPAWGAAEAGLADALKGWRERLKELDERLARLERGEDEPRLDSRENSAEAGENSEGLPPRSDKTKRRS